MRRNPQTPLPYCDVLQVDYLLAIKRWWGASRGKGLEMIFMEGRVPERIGDIPFGTRFFGGVALVLATAALIGALLA